MWRKGKAWQGKHGGVNESDIWSILKKVVLVDYGIAVERPFYKTRVSVHHYFKELREHFDQEGRDQ